MLLPLRLLTTTNETMLIAYPIKKLLGELYKNNIEGGDGGFFPLGANHFWHGGIHLYYDVEPIRAIAEGRIIAYRTNKASLKDEKNNTYSNGFVLVEHNVTLGEKTNITFYSLYMHLLPADEYSAQQKRAIPDFIAKKQYAVGGKNAKDSPLGGLNLRNVKDGKIVTVASKGLTVQIDDSTDASEASEYSKAKKRDPNYQKVVFVDALKKKFNDCYGLLDDKRAKLIDKEKKIYEIITSEDKPTASQKKELSGLNVRSEMDTGKDNIIYVLPKNTVVGFNKINDKWGKLIEPQWRDSDDLGYISLVKTIEEFSVFSIEKYDEVVRVNIPIYPGYIIGYAGPNRVGKKLIHLEIFFDKIDFMKNPLKETWGAIFYKVPAGTKFMLKNRIEMVGGKGANDAPLGGLNLRNVKDGKIATVASKGLTVQIDDSTDASESSEYSKAKKKDPNYQKVIFVDALKKKFNNCYGLLDDKRAKLIDKEKKIYEIITNEDKPTASQMKESSGLNVRSEREFKDNIIYVLPKGTVISFDKTDDNKWGKLKEPRWRNSDDLGYIFLLKTVETILSFDKAAGTTDKELLIEDIAVSQPEYDKDKNAWVEVVFDKEKNKIGFIKQKDLEAFQKLSSADWLGWEKEEEGEKNDDGFCDVETMNQLVDKDADSQLTVDEIKQAAPMFYKTACLFPTEWDASADSAQKWKRLKEAPWKMTPETFKKEMAIIKNFVFMNKNLFENKKEGEKKSDIDLKKMWHVHPLAFIEHINDRETIDLKEAQKIAFFVTANFETGGKVVDYNGSIGNFDGQGISWGAMQWNLGQGSFQDILKRMKNEYPDKFKACFDDDDYNTFVKIIEKQAPYTTNDLAVTWSLGIQSDGYELDTKWEAYFDELANVKEFQEIQYQYGGAKNHNGAKIIIDWLRNVVPSLTQYIQLRSYVCLFDLVNQQGSISDSAKEGFASYWQKNPPVNQMELFKYLGKEYGLKSSAENGKWRSDCISRRLGILDASEVASSEQDNAGTLWPRKRSNTFFSKLKNNKVIIDL